MKYIKYLSYVARHKWYVFLECTKRGLVWRGFKHDVHKLLPSEFFPYADHFYGQKLGARNGTQRDKTGYYKPTDTGDPAFDFAWLLHQKRADHHWQWWVLPEDGGGVKVLPMSIEAREEMVCDWIGASRAQGYGGIASVREWYAAHAQKMNLHKETKDWVETELGIANEEIM